MTRARWALVFLAALLLLWIGGRYLTGRRSGVEFAFGEDLRSHASPDFTVWIGFAMGL